MNLTVEEFVMNNKGIIMNLARKYTNTDLGIEYDDLFQIACLKLIESYNKYDSEKCNISTFVYNTAHYAILNYVRDNMVPAHISKELLLSSNRLLRANIDFYKKNGRQMTEDEAVVWIRKNIPEKNYTNEKKYLNKLNYIIFYHFNNKYYSIELENEKFAYYSEDSEDDNYKSLLEKSFTSNSNVEEEVISNMTIERFIKSLSYLTLMQKEIFLERLGLKDGIPKSNKDLSIIRNTTEKSIRTNYSLALKKIRERSNENNLI